MFVMLYEYAIPLLSFRDPHVLKICQARVNQVIDVTASAIADYDGRDQDDP